jgi:hypothetical protein
LTELSILSCRRCLAVMGNCRPAIVHMQLKNHIFEHRMYFACFTFHPRKNMWTTKNVRTRYLITCRDIPNYLCNSSKSPLILNLSHPHPNLTNLTTSHHFPNPSSSSKHPYSNQPTFQHAHASHTPFPKQTTSKSICCTSHPESTTLGNMRIS